MTVTTIPTIFDSVFDSSQSIADGVFDLCDGVRVRSLDQQGDRHGVLAVFHKRVLLLSLLSRDNTKQ